MIPHRIHPNAIPPFIIELKCIFLVELYNEFREIFCFWISIECLVLFRVITVVRIVDWSSFPSALKGT